MHELIELVQALRNREHERYRMQAALKGINIDKNSKNEEGLDPVEAAKRRVAMRESGLNEGQFEAKESESRLKSIGFSVNKVTR